MYNTTEDGSHGWKIGDLIEWDVIDLTYMGRITSICQDTGCSAAAVTAIDAKYGKWVVDLTEARRVTQEAPRG